MRKLLVAVTGSVGSGKSTVSEGLARLLGYRHVDVGALVRENRRRLGGKYDRKRKAIIADLEKTRKFLRSKRLLVKGAVVEGHYSQDVVDSPDLVFVLRCEPKELDSRLLARKYPQAKRAENIMAEILDSCSIEAEARFGKERVLEIDTTGRKPEAVAGELAKIILGKKAHRRKSFDYSEKYLGPGLAGKLRLH